MSRKLEQTILDSRHYKSGESFKANDIQTLIRGRGKVLTITTIKKSLGKLSSQGLIKVLPKATEDGGNMYIKANPQTFEDGKPLASRPWRPGRVVEDHSPRWC